VVEIKKERTTRSQQQKKGLEKDIYESWEPAGGGCSFKVTAIYWELRRSS